MSVRGGGAPRALRDVRARDVHRAHRRRRHGPAWDARPERGPCRQAARESDQDSIGARRFFRSQAFLPSPACPARKDVTDGCFSSHPGTRNDGGSHNPEETMDMEDFELAVEVLGGLLADAFRATDGQPHPES